MRITKLLSALLFGSFFRFSVEDSGGGGGGGGNPPANPDARATFTREYVSELREEAKMWRLKFQERDGQFNEASKKLTDSETAHKTALTDADTRANQRVMRAELKAHAVKAGLVDMEALDLLDLSSVKFNDKGELEGVDALFEAAKKAKPYLFGAQNTGSTEKKPPPAENTPKDVRNLSAAEYEAEKAKMVAASRKR
ncbi:hypothetical protein [Burkholderia sp. BCC0322]|uniref:phage scaffolding protein n=1 Tax=unclassified Burkholderia TaxID=2613784 RepID=UPI00158D2F37|nr:hypothetical protein [Burkholderia sp. BCC0322]